MTWADWIILALLAATTVGGIAQGFFRTACSLIGLIFGLTLASWNYARVGSIFMQMVKVEALANAIGFIVIAVVVMMIANVVGGLLTKTFRWLGLGCLDSLLGALLGFAQGAVLVMICILATVAFFPGQRWLAEAQLPKMFIGACHLSTHVTPGELGNRVREGLRLLEHESPQWMHPGGVS